MNTFSLGKYAFSPYMACENGCKYCDGRAEKYFQNILEDFGFGYDVSVQILTIMKTKLASAREHVGELVCYGHLSSGEYIAVELVQSDYGFYWYGVNITTFPMCDASLEKSA